ncbi:MAG: sigma 54-interacting transcriptional regulator, partial [Myxococcota bacterium]|nr:sigma 54-interacting transcriptional regulator [Myxococcota bacterium]
MLKTMTWDQDVEPTAPLLEKPPVRQDASRTFTALVMVDGNISAHPLPKEGQVIFGRGQDADIQIDERSVSRQHARLHLGPNLLLEDLASNNGTKVREQKLLANTPIEVFANDVIDLGGVMLVLQQTTSSTLARRVVSHAYFEMRLEEECDRPDNHFSVARIKLAQGCSPPLVQEILGEQLDDLHLLGAYAPNEYEIILLGSEAPEAQTLIESISLQLQTKGIDNTFHLLHYPKDAQGAQALMTRSTSDESTSPREQTIVQDPAMQRLYTLVERVAKSDLAVLFLGETGVGKEVLASHLHAASHRANAELLTLNCTALSETLLESELFGHMKGSFTGAAKDKPGLLESANGGSVFLDELGEMPMSVQVKLLRVLEQKEVTRVGGLKPIAIDVRFIAATNADLEEDIAAGTFREDLYYRLNGMSLIIPPLRERPLEIIALAEHFIGHFAQKMQLEQPPTLGTEIRVLLQGYGWPGNIRELRNMMERAVVLCLEDTILPEHLPMEKFNATLLSEQRSAGTQPGA